MSSAPRQLVFELPHRSALGIEDFLVGASNAAVVELVDSWPAWPHWAAVVSGPEGAGKSHLGHVWRQRSGAGRVAAPDMGQPALDDLARTGALLVEDLHAGIGDEQALFHALNIAREHKWSILLTSRKPPGELAVTLPDLRSRLRALPLVAIAEPDEGLLAAVLVKLFTDRQLEVEPHVVGYLTRHMERSIGAAGRVVAEADRLALARRARVTRAIAASALRSVGGADADADTDADAEVAAEAATDAPACDTAPRDSEPATATTTAAAGPGPAGKPDA